jgi:ribosomal protein S6--L-glutamate ligase
MVESRDKPYVIEANINPGLRGIEKATNINVAQRIMDYVKSEIKR